MQPDAAFAVLQFLIPAIEREHAITVKVMSEVPSEHASYSPDAKSMKALDLVWHIAASEQFFMIGASAGTFPAGGKRPETLSTPAAIVAWYQEQSAANLAKVKQMTAEEAARPIEFHGSPLVAVVLLQLMMNHSVHHRGQLSAYLRPMGALVPGIYGSSADAEALAAREARA